MENRELLNRLWIHILDGGVMSPIKILDHRGVSISGIVKGSKEIATVVVFRLDGEQFLLVEKGFTFGEHPTLLTRHICAENEYQSMEKMDLLGRSAHRTVFRELNQ